MFCNTDPFLSNFARNTIKTEFSQQTHNFVRHLHDKKECMHFMSDNNSTVIIFLQLSHSATRYAIEY